MIKRVKLDDKEIILVGTAHISKESIDLVEKTIEEEQPDVIGVELDKDRLEQLLSGKKWQQTDMVEIVKSGRTYLFLFNVLLSNMQKQLGKSVGVAPGAEMMAAVKKASEIKVPVHLLDRDVKITLKRAINAMSLREKISLGGGIVSGFFGKGEKITPEMIEELKKEDLINKLMKDMGKQMPSIKKVLVDERDDYISEMIRRSPGKKVVVVVGAGHLVGIVENIKSKRKIDIKKISIIPKGRNYLKLAKYVIPLIFVLLFAGLFYFKGFETTITAFGWWFLFNGICAAVGATLARAHPFSIITAFLAAPFTSIHPAFAAGWFSALVEAKVNPPRVMDFEKLSDVGTMSGFYKNKVTHLLIVAALTNVGSIIGTILALPFIVGLFV